MHLRALTLLVAARRAPPPAGAAGALLVSYARALSTPRRARAAVGADARAPAAPPAEGGGSSFFSTDAAPSFAALGLDDVVVAAARRAGFERPSRMQQLAVPELLADERERETGRRVPAHVVLTGETGSGKTLAYVLPVMQRLLAAPAAGARALVLVPSPALADQVLALAARLVDEAGAPLVRAEAGGLADAPYALPGNPLSNAPAIVVSTPTGIVDHLQVHYSAASSRRWFVRHVRHLVLDEADTLLSAGFDKPLRTLFSLMLYGRYDHPMLSKIFSSGGQQRHLYQTLSMLSRGSFEADPQIVLSAATLPAGNSPRAVGSMLAAALPSARWPRSERIHRPVEDVAFDWRELDVLEPPGRAELIFADTARRAKAAAVAAAAASAARGGGGEDGAQPTPEALAAAAGLELAPPPPPDEQLATIISPSLAPAVAQSLHAAGGDHPCALVFCNKAVHADALAAGLRLHGLRAATYHRAVPRAERESALRALSRERAPGDDDDVPIVLVCTDAAARGLDLPAVEHVVHAEFAQNAVSFLHRSGRVGRAGRAGRVTCLYTRDDAELVAQLRAAMDAGAALEPVFSRRRSFRKRIRRARDGEAAAVAAARPPPPRAPARDARRWDD
ncbi:hypothetical protein KFE25_001174 [Diacronema lutheri]|uniref:RNA helicase n=1 Tax=Diacronema lutheri TaxID=2081491 RepID=A0A8J6C9G5_DIALT|nr:hypothetical protein KFE25_001174 [Diacronema lutheri]